MSVMDGQLRASSLEVLEIFLNLILVCLDMLYLYITVSVLCFYGVYVCVRVSLAFCFALLPILQRQREKEDKQLEGWGGGDNLERKEEN